MLALLALAVLAPGAAASVPTPVTKTNTVRVPALGNLADGTLTTKLTYKSTTAAAAASTGTTIGLGRGYVFRLRTCVGYHLHGGPPLSSCAQRDVDTRANGATIYTYAPPVTLSQPRPTTQPWAYFTPYVEVSHQSGGSWPVDAHSWPDDGLQGAGIAVAAPGQTVGNLPPSSRVTFDTPFTSAINSGQADSICTAQVAGSDGSPLPADVSTSHPAFSGARAAPYEVGLPAGAYAGRPPRGVMLVIHGGGWTLAGAGGVQAMRPEADRWRARGWETVNLTYRPCGQSAADALWFHDKARAWFGGAAKLCAIGTSAGGHLALLVAAQRAGVYCVISLAGPTDLRTIQHEAAYDVASGQLTQTVGGRWVHNLAAAAFGEENLPSFSPAARPSPTLASTRVLQGFSADDAIVPYQQAADLAAAMRAADPAAYVDDVQLAIGTISFAHGRVTQAALDDFLAREAQLVAPLG